MKKLLVVVDMQNDFVTGPLGSTAAQKAEAVLAALLPEWCKEGEVAFTLDTHGEDYFSTREGKLLPVKHCVKRTAGWEIVPALKPFLQNAVIFEKPTFGSVALADYVKRGNYDEVTFAGVCTDICVVSNALLVKAYCPELEIKVLSACTAGTSEEAHEAALLTMRSCQITVL